MEIIRKPIKIKGSPQKDECVIAIGDIHGHVSLLKAILKAAKKTIPAKAEKVELVILGDIIDRGHHSKAVIDLLMDGIKGWKTKTLMGNHEQVLLQLLDASKGGYETLFNNWSANGGMDTLNSFDAKLPVLHEDTVKAHRKEVMRAIGKDRLKFIEDFDSHHRNGDILCVHGGIDPKRSLKENFRVAPLDRDANHWAWIRDPFLTHKGSYPEDVYVVHGHTIIPGPKIHPHRIGLDTGAYRYGVLSGATFYNGQMTIFQVTPN